MSELAKPIVRFNLVGALWVAGGRLRRRWSPIFAIAICLVGFPSALVGAAGAGPTLIGILVGLIVGAGLSGLSSGAEAWLALDDGEDPWAVAVEALSRAVYKLPALAALVVLVNVPSLTMDIVWMQSGGRIMDPWAWWGLSLLMSLGVAAVMAAIAPVIGILMYEGGGLLPALRRALSMTEGSRGKLLAIEVARPVLLQAVWFGQVLLPSRLDPILRAGLLSMTSALIGVIVSVAENQAYAQLHWNAGGLSSHD